jgi:hypothetical protein
MGESRGRKGKKAKWQVSLGIKELIFTGLGVAGLVMMSFALGTLAGRGDIYRVLDNWGLLGPEGGKAIQTWYQAPPPPSTPMATLARPSYQKAPAAKKPVPAQAAVADKAPTPGPVKGAIAVPPSPPPAKKNQPKQDVKAKKNNLQKIRREVAHKLKFQNSLDLATTRSAPPDEKSKKQKTAAPKPSTSQVIVAKYRSASRARARLSQMSKQGEKVILKEGNDREGRYFAIYRQVTTIPLESHNVTQSRLKKSKIGNKPNKTAAQ